MLIQSKKSMNALYTFTMHVRRIHLHTQIKDTLIYRPVACVCIGSDRGVQVHVVVLSNCSAVRLLVRKITEHLVKVKGLYTVLSVFTGTCRLIYNLVCLCSSCVSIGLWMWNYHFPSFSHHYMNVHVICADWRIKPLNMLFLSPWAFVIPMGW